MLIIIIITVVFRLVMIEKELINMKKQLEDYNSNITNKKITLEFMTKNLEGLAETINKSLEQNKKLIIDKNNVMEKEKDLIANISHDIRTPLTAIIGYLQVLKKRAKDGMECDYLDITNKKAKELEVLVNQFFMLSILEKDGLKLNKELININELIFESVTSEYENFEERGIKLDIDITKEEILFETDRLAFKRMIDNLISNVLKHGEEDAKVILDKSENEFEFIISNKVSNFGEEDLDRLFDKFYKRDLSRGIEKSSGLGLSITKELVEKLDGKIEVEFKENFLSFRINF